MCDKEQQFISDTLSWDSLENRPYSNNHTTTKNAKRIVIKLPQIALDAEMILFFELD